MKSSTSFPMSNGSNTIPKIKIEDISYQSDCSNMNWQRSDCYQPNADNCLYLANDGRVQANNYSDPSTSCVNGLIYTDLSNHCNQTPVNTSNYQVVYAPNQMPQQIPQQNGPIQAINEPNYQNGPEMVNGVHSSAITGINTNLNVSGVEKRSDSVQTLAPTVMSALNDTSNLKNIHFIKTIEFLRATDLLNLTLQTAELIKKNLEIQKEINNTKQLLSRFVTT